MSSSKKKNTSYYSFSKEKRNETNQIYRVLLKDGKEQICPNQPIPMQNSLGTVSFNYPPCVDICPFLKEVNVLIGQSNMGLPGIALLCQKMPVRELKDPDVQV